MQIPFCSSKRQCSNGWKAMKNRSKKKGLGSTGTQSGQRCRYVPRSTTRTQVLGTCSEVALWEENPPPPGGPTFPWSSRKATSHSGLYSSVDWMPTTLPQLYQTYPAPSLQHIPMLCYIGSEQHTQLPVSTEHFHA